jgi:hypothetical protein
MADAAFLTASSGVGSSCTTIGCFSQNAAVVNVSGGQFNNCKDGIVALSGSSVNANLVSAVNCLVDNVRVASSRINLDSSTLTGAGGICVHARQGSHVSALNVQARKTEGVDSTSDLRAINGSIIQGNGAVGGTNITPNSITANGIIFK